MDYWQDRCQAMASGSGPWDLSPEDIDAIKTAVEMLGKLQAERKQYRLMSLAMARLAGWPSDEKPGRASGYQKCDQCGAEYHSHPASRRVVMTCDGKLWKLI